LPQGRLHFAADAGFQAVTLLAVTSSTVANGSVTAVVTDAVIAVTPTGAWGGARGGGLMVGYGLGEVWHGTPGIWRHAIVVADMPCNVLIWLIIDGSATQRSDGNVVLHAGKDVNQSLHANVGGWTASQTMVADSAIL